VKKTEILIVGHGLAGSLLAWKLWQQGADFLVLDAGQQPASSAVAGGLFVPVVFRTLRPVGNAAILLEAMDATYPAMEEALGGRFLHYMPSVKIISPDEIPQWETAQKTALSPYIHKFEKHIDLPGIRKGFAGVYTSHSGFLDLKTMLEAMGRRLQENGLLVREHAGYEQIRISGKGIEVNGRYLAEKLVFCEGPHATGNPWFGKTGLNPNKGEILSIHSPGLDERHVIRGDVFVLPRSVGHFRVGATYSRAALDWQPSGEGRQELLEKLERFVDVPFTITGHHAGLRPAVRDRRPLLGSHPGHPDLCIFNGLGSRGVMLGPYWAGVMAEWLTGKISNIPAEGSVQRYF
jgi:glycine oxidase